MTEIERRLKKAEQSGKIKTSTQTERSAASSYSETSDTARRLRIAEEQNRKYSAPEANRRAAMQRKTESWMDFTTEAEPEARAAIDRYKATEDAKYYAAMNQRGATIGNDAMQERGFAGYKGAYDLWKSAFDRETDAAADRTRREREMTENPAKAAPTPEEARQQAEESVQYWQNVAREAAIYGDVYRQATARKHLADSVENYSRATKGYFDNLKTTDPGTYYALTMTPEEIDHELELLNNGAYLDSKITNSLTNDERIMGEYWHRTPQEQRQYEHNLERARFAGETDDERNAYISSEKEAYRDARNRMLNDASVEGSVGSNQEPYNRREEITQANEARKSVLENARLTQKVIQADREGITNDPQIIASGKHKFEADQQGIWDRWVPEQGWTTQAGGVQMDNLANAAEHGYVLDRMDEMTEEQRARIYSLYDRDPETALKLAQTYAKALDDKFYQKIFDWAAKDSGWQFGRRAVGNLAGAVMNLASGLDPFGYGGQSAGKVGDALIGGAAQSATRNGWFGIEELGGDQSWIDSSVPFIGRGRAGEASQLVSSMEQSTLTTLPALVAGRYDAAAASWLETAGLLLQSSSAARSDYRESIEAGLDDTTAKIHAVAAGIAEYTFEKVSFDKLLAQNTSRMTFKKAMKDVLVQAGIEGSEELHTTLANTIMDEIISGDGKSKIDRRIAELVQGGMSMREAKGVAEKEWLTGIVNDFIGGAASGGFMTGAHYAVGATVNTAENKIAGETRKEKTKAGAAVSRSEGSVEAIQAYAKDNGIEIKAVETAEQNAGESAEQGHQDGSKQNSYSNRDYRSISDTNSKVVQSIRSEVRGKTVQEQQTIRDNLVEKYGDGIAPVVNQAISVETAARVRQEYGSVDSIQAARNQAVSEIKDESLRQAVSDGYDSAAYALAANQGGEAGMNTMSRYIQQRRNTGSGAEMTMNATVTAQDGSTKSIAITGMSEDGKRVSLADGSEIAVKDLQADADTTSAIQQLADLDLGADATKVLQAYQQSGVAGTDGYRWLMDYATAYNQGRTRQISLEQAAQRSSLDERTVMDAYTLGQQAANRETQAGLEKLKNLPKRKGASGRTANIDTTEIQGKTMSKSELEQFALANQYAQALGVDMKWFSSKEQDGKFVGKNGAYENGKIYMDIHAGRNFTADLTSGILATMGHELTHFQQQYAPEEYQALKSFLFEQIAKSSPNGEARLERLIWEKQRRSGNTLSRKAAEDEVVADACQKMLRDSKTVHDFASQQPEAANGVVRWLDKWFKKVRSIFGRGGNYSEEAQIMDSLEQDVKAAFGELWDKALKQAVQVHDEVGNIEKATTEGESKAQNSDRDAEYLELAKDPDKNAARLQEMVGEAARKAGYTSPMLFHGTNAFGFTTIKTSKDVHADGFSFWAANKESAAGTYTRYGKTREIESEIGYEETEEAIEERSADVDEAIDDFRYLIDRTFSEWFYGQQGNEVIRRGVDDSNPDPGSGDGVYDFLVDQVADAFNEYSDSLSETYEDFADFQDRSKEWEKIEDAIVAIEGAYSALSEIQSEGLVGGIYELYANTDNMYVVDAKGAAWDALHPEGLPKIERGEYKNIPYKTRDVANWARDNGYDGVIFKNIKDNGAYGRTESFDVYAFFNPQAQVKSADPVTYDDAGNVIPLSERFNEANEDIRYSERDNAKPRSAQTQRDAGYKLSESKFYSLYSAHKLNMTGKGNVQDQIASIMADGFKGDGGFGNNVMPTNISYDVDENGKRIPRGLSAQKYAPKKGEYILLVPKEGVEVKGGRYNFTERVKPGYKPAFDYEIVQADYDGQPYYEMYERAYDKSQAGKADVTLDSQSESAAPMDGLLYSERTWSESRFVRDRENAAKALAKALNVSVRKAEQYIDDINSVAKAIADDRARLDYMSSPGRSAFKSNAEYGGSIDFSTLCKKRQLLTGTFNAIQHALANTVLTAEDVLRVRKMMQDAGLEVNCGMCYVEGSRARMGEYNKTFLELYKKYFPDNWQPKMEDVNTTDGLELMRMEHPECYEQYEHFYNNHGTLRSEDKAIFSSQAKPKEYQLRTEYKGEIKEKFQKDSTVEAKNLNGGLRMQSFSDFEIVHLIDCMQVIMDMSEVGLAGQAYTKVPEFAEALGRTGLKINLSLVAKGVDENGKLIFNDVEGMPHERAFGIREKYSENVGTILVVYDDAQLVAAMADDKVDFIIPFHRSQWRKSQYAAMGLPKTTKDYTYQQNEKWLNPKAHTHEYRGKTVPTKCTNYMPNDYWDFSLSGKQNAEKYLEMCANDGKRPKFYKLLQNNGDGTYSLKADGSTDGYWKLLIDFKMYDNNGVGVPQQPVQPIFDMDNAMQMLDDYSGDPSRFPVAEGIVDEFVSQYKAEHPDRQYSERDYSTPSDEELLDAVQSTELNDTEQKRLLTEYQTLRRQINSMEKRLATLEENRAKLNEKIQGGKEYSEKYVSIKDREIENLRREIETSREYLQEKMLTPKLADLLNAQRRNAAAKAKQQKEQAFQKYKEGKKAGELRRRIVRHSKELYGKLTKPSDKRHIPEAYRGAVAALLNTINLESAYDIQEGTKNESGRGGKHVEKGTGTATNRTKAFQEVRKQLEKVLAEGGFTGELINNAAEGFDGGLIEKCQDFADKPISTLSSEELETLWNTIRALEHNITTFNKAFALAKNETISGLADSFLASAQKRKPLLKDPKSRLDLKIKKTSGAAMKALENPYTFFSHYGEEGIKLYRALRDTQDLEIVRTNNLSDLWVRKMADILGDEKTAKLNGDELTNAILDKIRDTSKQMDEKVETFKLENGQTITLTHAMLMDVYLLAQRGEVGMNHLLGSGLIQPEIRAKGKYVARDPSFRKLSLQDVQKLTGVITENATEKAIADAIQSMQHQLADWGNKASMDVFGYRKFTEDNYWPVKNAKEENKSDSGKGGNQPANVMNKGMAKNLVPHAATGMEPMSAFTKLQGSISDMLMYATWGPVMEDFKRFYNWKWLNPNGGTSDTVKGVMERYGGEGSQRYWEELRDQINNGIGNGKNIVDQFIGKAVGAVKGARVAYNLRVVVQQPTAYARAAEVISGKYLAASLLDIKSWGWKAKSAWNRALTHSPIAMRKDSTIYDMGGNISAGGEFGLDRPGYLDKARDFGTALAGKADAITWGRLWHAAELQISAKTNLEHGSQEYWDAVNKLFTEAVDRTQVVDGLLQRPAIMRTDSDFVKGATSYMGEPLMQLNMLMRQVNDFRQTGFKATKKQIGKTVTALVVTQLFNAMLTGLYDAGIRKDDEDKDFWERFVAEITGLDGTEENAWDYITSVWLESNATSEMSVMQKIPLVKDVLSMLQGYDPSNNRMDLDAIKDLIDVCTKVLWNDNYTPLYKAKEMINKASMIFGAGFGNALKDMYGFTRNIINDFGKPQARFDFKALWLNPASKKNKSQYFDILAQMAENGDKDAFRQRVKLVRDDGMSNEKFFEYVHEGMTDAFRKRYFNHKLKDDQAVTLLMQYSGKDEKDAWNTVRKWKDQAKHVGADGKLPDGYKWNQYDELKAEVATGNDISELIQTYKANGYSETQINGAIRDSIQEALTAGDLDEKEAADALIQYGVTYSKDGKTVVYDKQSAWKKVQEWADKAEHTNEEGELEDGYKYSTYSDLFEAVDANKNADGVIQAMVQKGGYDEDSLRGKIKDHLLERFIAGQITETALKNQLSHYCKISKADDANEIVANAKCKRDFGVYPDGLKEAIKEGDLSQNQAVKALQQYNGLSKTDAQNRVQYWVYDGDLSESAWLKWNNELKRSGLSVENWEKVSKVKSDAKGTDANGDGKADYGTAKAEVVSYIDSMNIPKSQKKAIYLAFGFAASTMPSWR